ncbi:MAG: serine protein kinase RIO [Planctomycetes bacterium]|nr:serine protein kinase RIO [Planctomycetota bacterium]
MPDYEEMESSLQAFIDGGWIVDVIGPLKSGKEATVYVCRAHPRLGVPCLAAKVHRNGNDRSFRHDASYQEGRWRRVTRASRAFDNKSRFGREVQYGAWLRHEWETLSALHEAGVSVPRPVDVSSGAILMEFVGEGDSPAPPLQEIDLTPEQAQRTLDRLTSEVERMLAANIVHGDLSAYNVLWWNGRPRIIDVPQAVDPRFNPNARRLLERDLENVHRYCGRHGARGDPAGTASRLWHEFRLGRL